MDSEYHQFSHAEKLPSPLHKDAESMEEAQDPEPRVRVSHLMSHAVVFFFSLPTTWVYIWRETKSHQISASNRVRGV